MRIDARVLNDRIPTSLRLARPTAAPDGKPFRLLEIAFDFTKVPAHEVIDLPIELVLHETPPGLLNSVSFDVENETALMNGWLLLPTGKRYQNFELLRYAAADATAPEFVVPANLVDSMEGQILGFSLLGLKPGFRYECRWSYRD